MTLGEYTAQALQFTRDSAGWSSLPDYMFYTTGEYGWEETPDNAHDGISIRWAFGESEETIWRDAAAKFLDSLQAELTQALDEDWDESQFRVIAEKYT